MARQGIEGEGHWGLVQRSKGWGRGKGMEGLGSFSNDPGFMWSKVRSRWMALSRRI